MQFKWLILKETTLFLVLLIMVGDNIEDTMTPPYAKCWRNLLMCFSLYQADYLHSEK